jgi:hypothetical protein
VISIGAFCTWLKPDVVRHSRGGSQHGTEENRNRRIRQHNGKREKSLGTRIPVKRLFLPVISIILLAKLLVRWDNYWSQ